MLGLIFSVFSLALCEGQSLIQTLVFGTDSSNDGSEHYCDCTFSPYQQLVSATIFKVINENQDQAVPCSRVFAVPSPTSAGYSRIEIPENLAVSDVSYSFQFEFADHPNVFSESFKFDKSRKQFALASSISENWMENPKVQIGAALVGIVALLGLGSWLYRRHKKSRSLYVQ